jgi:hypothetical protein
MRGRIQEDDETVPVRDGGFYYYTRTIKDTQYRVRACRPPCLPVSCFVGCVSEAGLSFGMPVFGGDSAQVHCRRKVPDPSKPPSIAEKMDKEAVCPAAHQRNCRMTGTCHKLRNRL